MNRFLLIALTLFCFRTHAVEAPGAVMRTAESLKSTYELALSPGYLINERGVYLSSEFRYQLNEDVGLGFALGSGEVGYNFGTYAAWYILPDVEGQPAFSLAGGLYFNRVASQNHMVLKMNGLASKNFKTPLGQLIPYGGLQLSPSFGLGVSGSEFSLKSMMGAQLAAEGTAGFKFWLEFGLGILNSMHQVSMGVSYPFTGA